MSAAATNPPLGGLRGKALIAGLAGLAVSGLGYAFDAERFFQSYLLAFLFWMALPLGSLGLLMLHHLGGGEWGLVIRRPLEAAAKTVPLMLAMALPVMLGLHHLYIWTHEDVIAGDEIIAGKAVYLNVGFFLARAAFYFIVWGVLAMLLAKLSARQDESSDASLDAKLQVVSGPGIVLMGLTVTFSAVDWAMSVDPHWFSTLFGFWFVASDVLAAMAFAILALAALRKREPLAGFVNKSHFHDLGNFLMAFVMIWGYLSFSQYLIIWSANNQEEAPWYVLRSSEGWIGVTVFLWVFHFFVPFTVLLTRKTKRHVQRLSVVAAAVLAMRFVDLYWIVMPSFAHGETSSGFHPHWLDLTTLVGVGGVWLYFFVSRLAERPLLPTKHPRLEAALEEAGGH